MSEPDQSAYHVIVYGRVQGVGFRYTAISKAQKLGLTGWVRNCRDGSVETRFEGSSAKTQEFLKWLQHGPPGARVERVDEQIATPRGSFTKFRIEY
jgi:acylphosphatase